MITREPTMVLKTERNSKPSGTSLRTISSTGIASLHPSVGEPELCEVISKRKLARVPDSVKRATGFADSLWGHAAPGPLAAQAPEPAQVLRHRLADLHAAIGVLLPAYRNGLDAQAGFLRQD